MPPADYARGHWELGNGRFALGGEITNSPFSMAPAGPDAAARHSLTADVGIRGGTGQWVDPVTGEEQRGTRAQGGAHLRFSDDRDPGHVHSGIDVGGLTFDAGVYAGEQTDGVGVTANLIEVGGDIGSTPTADSHHDASVRVAGSMGVGLGVRLHHGDEDHDGIRDARDARRGHRTTHPRSPGADGPRRVHPARRAA